jgi:hypothetical protein
MTLSTFDPRETERFKYCCGGSRRWELVEARKEWFWELGSSWGQAHISDLVLPANNALTVRVDLTNPAASVLSVAFVTNLRVGRLGIDGLPFRAKTWMTASVGKGFVQVQKKDTEEPSSWSIPERMWTNDAFSFRVRSSRRALSVFINGDKIGQVSLDANRPSLLLLGGNGRGGGHSSVRVGQILVEAA